MGCLRAYGLVGSVDGDVEVLGLSAAENGQLDVELREVCAGDLFIELLGEHVNAERELLGGSPQRDLSKDLVCKGARHDKGRVTSGTAEVDKTSFSEENDVTFVGHGVTVDLGLHIGDGDGIGLEPGDIDLDVEVTDAVVHKLMSVTIKQAELTWKQWHLQA